uniref:membrane-bound lytic murein transglycosylase MltF n=1 Tax=Klebsiella sp. RIT-PI-d TaxID=1681196 RepID=UPI0011E5858B|nr:membrane-bound lytic murein transglycosylase MltF [Klebsiella sp. RIT-PI-d]
MSCRSSDSGTAKRTNCLKKIKIIYPLAAASVILFLFALLTVLVWQSLPENRLAAIRARGELRISTITSPMTYININGKVEGFDYELAQQFADQLGVRLKVTIRPTIDQLFDDLDNGNADLLAAGLVWNSERAKHYQPGPPYSSVSQQLVYRMGSYRPRSLESIGAHQLTIAPGHAVINDLRELKAKKFPDLNWTVDHQRNSRTLMEDVVAGRVDYTITDSGAISLFQRVHPELAVALDVTDEQPVTWFSVQDEDKTLSEAMQVFFDKQTAEGTIARLEEKYLGHGRDFDYVDTRSFLRAVDSTLPDFQPLFEKYADTIDWRLLAAIAYQESHWDPQATSSTGVRGMMMLTRNTAQSLGLSDRTDAEQSISGGMRYLRELIGKVPDTVPENERIWFALAAYNMGYAHMLDVRALTAKQNGNPDSWADVKQRLPLLSQKPVYGSLTYGYARGHEAYAFVENIRKYQISLVGYLIEKERMMEKTLQLSRAYPAVSPETLEQESPSVVPFISMLDSGYGTHSKAPVLADGPRR